MIYMKFVPKFVLNFADLIWLYDSVKVLETCILASLMKYPRMDWTAWN